jgi:hypothetical protein
MKYVFKDRVNQENGNWVGTMFLFSGKFIMVY